MSHRPEELNACLEQCARELPAGYQVTIAIEFESGSHNLIGPDGEEIEYPSNHEYGLAEDAVDALNHAKELASG